MPTSKLKGIAGLYETCCEGSFYEWVIPKSSDVAAGNTTQTAERRICMAPVWYNDDEALTLIEDRYDPMDEFNSTWKLCHFSKGLREKRLPHRPYKLFNLETDDDLVVVKCKIRPVLLIRNVTSDWRVPGNMAKIYHTWLCLPIFTYKQRHSQPYVLKDQALQLPHHFYFPPGMPGLDEEGVGKLTELQFIPEQNIFAKKKMCDAEKMQLPFCLTKEAYQSVIGHIANFFPGIEISGEAKEWYDFFVELVSEEIAKFTSSIAH
ncbi:MAG: hypothetical protein KJ936_09250 [Proteobacteria bacterium]|nr:hypothetical protein [Pseudomonadota bacterium]